MTDVATCDRNELVPAIHPKAMVAILVLKHHARGLSDSYEDAFQRPIPADRMVVRGSAFPTRKLRA